MTLESGKHALTFRGKVLVHLIKPQDDAKDAARKPQGAPSQVAAPAPAAEVSTPLPEMPSPIQTAVPQ